MKAPVAVLLCLLFMAATSCLGQTTTVTKYVATSDTTPPAATTNIAQPIEVIDASFTVTEKNSVWWRFSWKVILHNKSTSPINNDIELQWLNAAGYEVNKDWDNDLLVLAGKTQTFSGSSLINTDVASSVASLNIKVE